MRVYIPATLAMLQQFVADGSMFPVSGTAFAVTPTLREAYAARQTPDGVLLGSAAWLVTAR